MRFIKSDYNSINYFLEFSLKVIDQNLRSLEYVDNNIKTVLFHSTIEKESQRLENVLRIKECSIKIKDLIKTVKKELNILSKECMRKEFDNTYKELGISTSERNQAPSVNNKDQSQINEDDKKIDSIYYKWINTLKELNNDIINLDKKHNFTSREKIIIDELYDNVYNIEKNLESLIISASNHRKKIDQIPNIGYEVDDIKSNFNYIPIKIRESLKKEGLRYFNKSNNADNLELIDDLWDLIIKKMKDLGIMYWEDKKLLDSLKVEVILELLNSVSIFTSPILKGADVFYTYIEFYDKNLVYENKNSSKCLDRWKLKYHMKKECIITSKPNNKINIRRKRINFTAVPHIKETNFKRNHNFKIINILNSSQEHDNLIYNYVESHMIIENELDKNRIIDDIKCVKAKENNEQKNHRMFLKHGSHLLGILLRASEELKLPFSPKCPEACTLGGLKRLQERIDIACQREIAAEEIEKWDKFLMKYNVECIYHLSYLAKVYEDIKNLDLNSSYRIFTISKYLIHMDSIVLSNYYIEEFNNVISKNKDDLNFEKELVYVQSLVLPLIKDLFHYYLYQVSQCDFINASNNNIKEEQLIDFIYPEPYYTLNDIKKRREEYNRLFLICSRYIDNKCDFDILNNYINTRFEKIDSQYEAHEVNLTSLLKNSYNLPELWYGDHKIRLEYLEALVTKNKDCINKIDKKIEKSISHIKGLQIINSYYGFQDYPFTDEYYRYHRQRSL